MKSLNNPINLLLGLVVLGMGIVGLATRNIGLISPVLLMLFLLGYRFNLGRKGKEIPRIVQLFTLLIIGAFLLGVVSGII